MKGQSIFDMVRETLVKSICQGQLVPHAIGRSCSELDVLNRRARTLGEMQQGVSNLCFRIYGVKNS